jgi:hypothetical protein
MWRRLARSVGIAGFAMVFVAGARPAAAQVELKSKAMELTITGRMHAQFNTTSVSGGRSSEYLIRRARITAELKINDFVSGKIQPDFGEGEISLKDAYIRLSFDPAFRITMGQFKRPFDVFELTSSTQILVVERAGGIRGVDTCTGPGGACTFSRLTEKLQFADRDIGLLVDGEDGSGRFSYAASVTNGTGQNVVDENGSKSFTGRVGVTPKKDVTIAAHVGAHDYVDPSTGDEYAVGFGGDVEIGNYSEGLHVQAGVVTGDNWRNLLSGGPSKFLSAQSIVTYKIPVAKNPFISHVEPVGRVSWGDPDTNLADDDEWLFTPGCVVYFSGRNKLGVNFDVWSPGTGSTETSLKVQAYLHF